jgi:hypothetical protein
MNINERMDTVIPASKIANQNAGEVVAIVSRGNSNDLNEYQTNTLTQLGSHPFKIIKNQRKLPLF